jgi:hypothetical protein
VGIRPLGPIELLIALKAIYRAMSLLISGSSVVIIWYIYVTGLTRSHVPARFDVLNPCLRLSRDTYIRSPTTPIYIRT